MDYPTQKYFLIGPLVPEISAVKQRNKLISFIIISIKVQDSSKMETEVKFLNCRPLYKQASGPGTLARMQQQYISL